MFRILFFCLLLGYNVHTFWFSQFAEYVQAEGKRSKREGLFPLTNALRREFLAAHNKIRANVKPPARGMKKMVWAYELELAASNLVSRCIWRHGKKKSPKFKSQGQNNFGGYLNATRIIEALAGEVANYNLKSHTCAPRKACGHYTQIVWDNSYLLGCAVGLCPNLGFRYFTACNYYPHGNYVGARPYDEGSPCADCPPKTCKDNLCDVFKCSDLNETKCTIVDHDTCLCGENEYLIAEGMALNSYLPVTSMALIKSFY